MPGTENILTTAFSPEKREEAKQLAQDLLHLFGEEEEGGSEDKKPKRSKKSTADVADRVLDMVSKSTAQIAGAVQTAAPQVWKIMVRQQFASALSDLIGPLLGLVMLFIIVPVSTSFWPKLTGGEELFFWTALLRVVPICIAIFVGIALIDAVTKSIKKLVNPMYYATRDLMKMILGRDIPE